MQNTNSSILNRAADCSVGCGSVSFDDGGAPMWIRDDLILGEGNDISSGSCEAHCAPAVVDQVRKAWVRWVHSRRKVGYERESNIRVCPPQGLHIIKWQTHRNNDLERGCFLLLAQSVNAALRVWASEQGIDHH
jgi:hypothetical protein